MLKGFSFSFFFFSVFLRREYCVNRYCVDWNCRNLRIVRKLIENTDVFDFVLKFLISRVNIEETMYKLHVILSSMLAFLHALEYYIILKIGIFFLDEF